MVRLTGVRRAAAVVAVAALGVLAPAAAWAAPVPDSGPVAGGTRVSDTVGVTFTAVTGSFRHSVAIGSDGHAYAWGYNGDGELGNGTTTNSLTPTQVATPAGVPTDFTFTAVDAGDRHSVAIGSDGHAYAWGYNDDGELGNGTTTNSLNPTQVATPAGVPADFTFTAVEASDRHSVAIGSDGHAYAWGYNDDGELGNGTTTNSLNPTQVATPAGVPADFAFTAVSAGYRHSVAIGSNGHAYSWGYNGLGQLGNGTTTNSLIPTPVATPAGVPADFTFTAVSAGSNHSVAIGSDGHAYAWGYNSAGQLGNGTTTDSLNPTQVATPAGVPADFAFTTVAGGSYHSMAIGSNGRAYGWGENAFGQLGDGTITNSPTPIGVATPAGAPAGFALTTVDAGDRHSVAIGSDGRAYAWGDNGDGQLGDGTTTDSRTPISGGAVTIKDVAFGKAPGYDLTLADNTWTATAPTSDVCGPVDVAVTYTQFGITQTATTSGGFTYTGTAPVITTQPTSATLDPGGSFTSTAAASGYPAPTIRWQQSTTGSDPWTDIPGATRETLTTNPKATTHYRAVFTSCQATTASDIATATIQAPGPNPSDTTTPSRGTTLDVPSTTLAQDPHGNVLPRTGTDTTPLIAAAITLLLIGTTTVAMIRRRMSARSRG